MKNNIIKLLSTFFIAANLFSCSSKDAYDVIVPPEIASFTGGTSAVFGVSNDPNAVFKIPVGVTTVSNQDRQLYFDITSPSAATATYTVLNNPVTIKAGSSADSLIIKGDYNSFTGPDDIDSLYISLRAAEGVKPAPFNNSYKLALRRFCPINLADFNGNFVVVSDAFQDTSPGDILVLTKISDNQFSFVYPSPTNPRPIVVDMDAAAGTFTIPRQTIGTDWSWEPSYKNPSVVGNGTYESCGKVITFRMTWGINNGASVFSGGPYILRIRKQ
jgi:hypothetical protein